MGPRDPVQFPVNPTDHQDLSREAASDLVKLARDALQEKRLRDCLSLTSAILKIDPENKHAHVIQSWVYADLDEEFQIATQVAEEARRRRSRETWNNAEHAARRVLNVMPEHDGAKTILAEALSSIQLSGTRPEITHPNSASKSGVASRPAIVQRKTRRIFAGVLLLFMLIGVGYVGFKKFEQPVLALIRSVTASSRGGQGRLDIQLQDGLQVFVDEQYRGSTPVQPLTLPAGKHQLSYKFNGILVDQENIEIPANGIAVNSAGKLLGRLDLVVVPSSGVELSVDGVKVGPTPSFLLLKQGPHKLSFAAEGHDQDTRSVVVTAGERSLIPVLLHEVDASETSPPPSQKGPSSPGGTPTAPPLKASSTAIAPVKTPPQPAPTERRGKLAITSSLPLQVYQANRLVGSTPTTLDLPVGEQTLEYRYENLRTEMTHLIKGDETTTVNVVMDTIVQINAQPWAEVLIQAGQVRSLGQTPLSGVRVPVGSLLVFRNPRFSDKTYRVTAKDATISVVFP